jgi:hypothetical protein
MGRPKGLTLVAVLVCVTALPGTAQAATTKTVRYGPFTVPASVGGKPGKLEKLKLGVAKPCGGCYITSFRPNLTYPNGTTANFNTGAMLHHLVLTNQFRRDATCGGTWLGLAGERFFASGNERTAITLPAGYGYRVRLWDSWNALIDIMNMKAEPQTFYIDITFTYRAVWESVKPVRPVWLDIDQCGDSEYSIPAGEFEATRDWKANIEGAVVAMAGHLHDHGVRIEATNVNTGQSICNSVAGYGSDPAYMGHIESMTFCEENPLGLVDNGHVVRIRSIYNSPSPANDVMGIMLAYIHPRAVP